MEHGGGAAGVPNSMWVVMCYSLQSISVTEKSVICMSEHIGVERQRKVQYLLCHFYSKYDFKKKKIT